MAENLQQVMMLLIYLVVNRHGFNRHLGVILD